MSGERNAWFRWTMLCGAVLALALSSLALVGLAEAAWADVHSTRIAVPSTGTTPVGVLRVPLGVSEIPAEAGRSRDALWANPMRSSSVTVGAERGATATADVAKFSDYAFVTDKAPVFESYGYTAEDSQQLADLYEQQAAQKFASGDYSLGKLDQYGQRITIQIDLPGQGTAAGRSTILNTGWMIEPDGSIRLLTPFAGFGQ